MKARAFRLSVLIVLGVAVACAAVLALAAWVGVSTTDGRTIRKPLGDYPATAREVGGGLAVDNEDASEQESRAEPARWAFHQRASGCLVVLDCSIAVASAGRDRRAWAGPRGRSLPMSLLLLLCVLPALFLAACGEGDEPPFSPPSATQSPTQPGPFDVGVRQMTFTKKSVTHPTQDRVLLTDIWYPTTPNASPLDVDLGGVVNAPWATGATHLPLLLFSHGRCSLPTLSRFFMRALASYGFIVAAPLHVGTQMTDPNCGINYSDGYANSPFDIRFVIDSLLDLDTNPTSFFSGAIDSRRIGMSGNSDGGNTTVLVSESDPRILAGLVLTGSPVGLVAKIHVPMMVQAGALDSRCPFDSCERPLYVALSPPKYLVEILHTGHTAFTDDGCYANCCGPSSDCNICFPQIPMPFCDAAGPDALSADAAHQLILRYAVPFLLHWVAGDTRFDAYLARDAAPPGVIFTADTGGTSTDTPTPTP